MANDFRNILSSQACEKDCTPYEIICDKVQIVTGLKFFGCKAFDLLGKNQRDKKFSERSVQGIFVGYGGVNYYRVYLPSKNYILTVRDVDFDELIMEGSYKKCTMMFQ